MVKEGVSSEEKNEDVKSTKKEEGNINIESLGDSLVDLKIKDIQVLADYLDKKYNIKPASPVVMSAQSSPNSSEQSQVEEKKLFTVVLESAGPNTMQVVKALREVASLQLMEAKNAAENAAANGGFVIKKDVSKEEADNIKKTFTDLGSTIAVK